MTATIEKPLKEQWAEFKKENSKTRIRDAAKALGVSEAALVATGVGSSAIRLNKQWPDMLMDFHKLGRVMALTRNDQVVHERHGVYNNPEVAGEGHTMALVLDPEIDLRIFFRCWNAGYAVTEQSPRGERKSLQFFDKDGSAVHKIYMTDKSDASAYDAFISKFKNEEQTTAFTEKPVSKRLFGLSDNEIDVEALRSGWDGLKDTHDFFPLINKLRVDRLQALRLAGEERAYELKDTALREVMDQASKDSLEIMVFVGSRGVIQIHSGKVENIRAVGDWYNVLDPDFNLHIKEPGIASIWLVKKPTIDGQVTSVECYDDEGHQVVQFFGKRKPGIPELEQWRKLAESLERK